MKILSVNKQHTLDQYTVAFNVDQPPQEGVVEKIGYGNLRIRYLPDHNVLIVIAPKEKREPITSTTLENLGEKIREQEAFIADKEKKARQ